MWSLKFMFCYVCVQPANWQIVHPANWQIFLKCLGPIRGKKCLKGVVSLKWLPFQCQLISTGLRQWLASVWNARQIKTQNLVFWKRRSLLSVLTPESCIRNSGCFPHGYFQQGWRVVNPMHNAEIHQNLPNSFFIKPVSECYKCLPSRVLK